MHTERSGPRRYSRRDFVRGLGIGAAALTLAPTIIACRGKSGTGAGQRAEAGSGARPHRGGMLTVRMAADATNLDYATRPDIFSQFVLYQCIEPLIAYDEQLRPRGLLAESWENPDERTYIFKLRHGATFHDGTSLTADSVEYGVKRNFGPGTGMGGNNFLYIDRFEKPDPTTITFVLSETLAPLLSYLAGNWGASISPASAEKLGNDRMKVDLSGLGSGPFRFVEWKSGDRFTLARHEHYWGNDAGGGRLPYLDKLLVRIVPDPSQALASLRTGELDAFRPGEGPAAKDAAAIKADRSLSLRTLPSSALMQLVFNQAREPFNRSELRQAISFAVDRQAIADNAFGGQVPAQDVIFGPSSWAYDPSYHPYLKRDVARAKQLLAQAGRSNGTGFTLMISGGQQVAELLQDQLKEAGISMSIQQVDNPKLIDAMRKGEHQAALTGFGAGVDPNDQMYPIFGSTGVQNFQVRYQNPDLTALLLQARRTLDQSQRKPMYQQAQRQVIDDAVVCILFSQVASALATSRVQRYPIFTNYQVGLSEVWKAA